jgi:hypothetical protein
MMGIIIALVAALGIGGTAVVADTARPGDALFGLDQAVEHVQLAFTKNEAKKDNLRIKFAEERLKEVNELVQEEKTDKAVATQAEDTMIRGRVDSLTKADQDKVELGIQSAITLLTGVTTQSGVEDARIKTVADTLNAYIDTLPEGAKVQLSKDNSRLKFDDGSQNVDLKVRKDGTTTLKIRTDDGRIRIESKDGEVKVKTNGARKGTSIRTSDKISDDEVENENEKEAGDTEDVSPSGRD